MSKKPLTWFRFYGEALDDPKVQRLSPQLFKTWVNLLCIASQNNGDLPSIDDIAFRLRMSVTDAEQQVSDLILAGLIDVACNGMKRSPHGWMKRQFASDRSTERVRKWRKEKKKTECNDGETLQETAPEQSRAETESEKVEEPPLPPKGAGPTPAMALEAFHAYNAVALRCGLAQAAKLTPDRQRRIIARLKDYGLEGWHQALANIEKSAFLTGGTDQCFRADLDFVLQAKSFGRLHDGGYGNGRHTEAAKSTSPDWRQQKIDRSAHALAIARGEVAA